MDFKARPARKHPHGTLTTARPRPPKRACPSVWLSSKSAKGLRLRKCHGFLSRNLCASPANRLPTLAQIFPACWRVSHEYPRPHRSDYYGACGGPHVIGGTRQTAGIAPEKDELTASWGQAMCAFQMLAVDLLAVALLLGAVLIWDRARRMSCAWIDKRTQTIVPPPLLHGEPSRSPRRKRRLFRIGVQAGETGFGKPVSRVANASRLPFGVFHGHVLVARALTSHAKGTVNRAQPPCQWQPTSAGWRWHYRCSVRL